MLDVIKGCSQGICVGDKVYKGNSFGQGARVIAINKVRMTVTVKSVYSGKLSVELPYDLDVVDLCLDFDSERYN